MKKALCVIAFLLITTCIMGITQNPIVKMETSTGDIIIELLPEKSPVTCENFLKYIAYKFYDNTLFHRVIPDFMIQGGGYVPGLSLKETLKPIQNEANNKLSNMRGTIAMARTYGINSATSQFFINVKDNIFLDHQNFSPRGFGYAVFGKVIYGMNIVDNISLAKTKNMGQFKNVPAKQIIIKSIRLIRDSKSPTENTKEIVPTKNIEPKQSSENIKQEE